MSWFLEKSDLSFFAAVKHFSYPGMCGRNTEHLESFTEYQLNVSASSSSIYYIKKYKLYVALGIMGAVYLGYT